jgi:hypothetical protein
MAPVRRAILLAAMSLGLSLGMQASARPETLWLADVKPGAAEPLADPWACRFHTWFLGAENGSPYFRLGLGTAVGLAKSPEAGWSWEGRAGVFSRFNFRSPSFDLQASDFQGGMAWRQAAGPMDLEAYAWHYSAHPGGDSALGAAAAPNISRETFRCLVFWPQLPFRFYLGPRVILRSDPGWMAGKVGLQGGAEAAWGPWFAAMDMNVRGEFHGDTDVTFIAGVNLSPARARFAQAAHLFIRSGHVLAGQGEEGYENLVGLGMMVVDNGPNKKQNQ